MDIWDTLEQIGAGLGEARKNVDTYGTGGTKKWGCQVQNGTDVGLPRVGVAEADAGCLG